MALWSKQNRQPDVRERVSTPDASPEGVDAAFADEPGSEPTSTERAQAVLAAARTAPRRTTDPIARALGVTILLIIVLTLVTVVYALVTGVFGNGAPRTLAEQRVVAAEAKVTAGSTDPIEWMAYILALTDDGQYRKAQEMIDKGKASLPDQEISADMLYMQADLHVAQGEFDKALEVADEAMNIIKTTYDTEKEKSDLTGQPSKAVAFGMSENYFELLLLKAEIYEQREEWSEALACYDEYLADHVTAATVFAQRGQVKEQLGDAEGAEADYRQTLVFIADNAEALAGLERIGADR